MFKIVKKEIEVEGKKISIETGKIPGGYFKREARPTESETLISRLIDRPIRPLFPDEFKNEVQLLPCLLYTSPSPRD